MTGRANAGRGGNTARKILDELDARLPDDPADAARVATAVCAARCIDAGMGDEEAMMGLSAALDVLRARGAGEGRH